MNKCGFRYDSRVKAMEVDERPTEQYSDIGGLDQQIQEVTSAPVNQTLTDLNKDLDDYVVIERIMGQFSKFIFHCFV